MDQAVRSWHFTVSALIAHRGSSRDCDVFHLYVVQSRNLTFIVRAERRHSWSADGAASLSLPLLRAAQTTPRSLQTEDYQQNGYENPSGERVLALETSLSS
jgi:hypothetical protein